jgi:3'-phosphoadenosine 5'-phosphosulfate sulfotransferase
MSLADVLAMEAEELSLWGVFLFGEHDLENRRLDERAAMAAMVSWNGTMSPKKNMQDFMPKRDAREARVQDPEVIKARLAVWAASTQGLKR